MAYAGQAKSGARFVAFNIDIDGRDYRETIYVTNKNGDNWFPNKDDKTKKVPLPGFTTVDDICLVTTGAPLADQDDSIEQKMVNVYDPDAKKELPKSVPVLMNLLNKTVSLGITKSLENRQERSPNGDYVPKPETRETNTIEKVFDTESKLTVVEARRGVDKAAFWDAWEARNKGQTRDKRTIKDGAGGVAGRPGQRPMAGPPLGNGTAAPAPRKSLFGNKAN